MRHLKAGNRLGVTSSHRVAMMRNMVTSIIENGQITCTLARAKEVRKPLEKMIGLGKRGTLHTRRQALRFVKSKEAMVQLFGDLAERFKERNGGYCRIIKLGKNRLGDNSEMAIIQLLGSEGDKLSELKTQKGAKKNQKKKGSTVLKEVSDEIQEVPKTLEDTKKELEKDNVTEEPQKGKYSEAIKKSASEEEERIQEEKPPETEAKDNSEIENKVKAQKEDAASESDDLKEEKNQTEHQQVQDRTETEQSETEKHEAKIKQDIASEDSDTESNDETEEVNNTKN